jgi:hypothetical protein
MMEDELHAVLNITLDGSTSSYYRPEAGDSVPRHSRIFSTDGLALDNHELVIENLVTGPFYLDYVVYATTGKVASSATQTVNPSAQPSGASSTIGPQTGPNAPNNSPSSNKPPVAGIVGGVIGGIAFLALLAALFFFLGRWRRLQSNNPTPDRVLRSRKSEAFTLGHFSPYTEAMPYDPFREPGDTPASQRQPLPNSANPFIIPSNNQLQLSNDGDAGFYSGKGRSPSASPLTPQSQEIRYNNEVSIPLVDLPRLGNESPRSVGSSGLSGFTLLRTPPEGSSGSEMRRRQGDSQAQTGSTPNSQQTFSSPSNITQSVWTSSSPPPPAYHELHLSNSTAHTPFTPP